MLNKNVFRIAVLSDDWIRTSIFSFFVRMPSSSRKLYIGDQNLIRHYHSYHIKYIYIKDKCVDLLLTEDYLLILFTHIQFSSFVFYLM